FALLMNLVGRAAPFHSTTDRPMKRLPLTVSVIPPRPARVLAGERNVTTGIGLSSGTRVARASNILTRGIVGPGPRNQNLVSVIGSPVWRSAPRTVVTLAPGTACLMTAHAPATCGAAIDVPLSAWY